MDLDGQVYEQRGKLATGREDMVRVTIRIVDPAGRARWASVDLPVALAPRYQVGRAVTVSLKMKYQRR